LYGPGAHPLTLQTIKCLLIYPNPESALDEEAGKQLLADYEGYCKVCPGCGDVDLMTRTGARGSGRVLWLTALDWTDAQYAKLMTSIHATPKVSVVSHVIWPVRYCTTPHKDGPCALWTTRSSRRAIR
jgi:hypothetical protein